MEAISPEVAIAEKLEEFEKLNNSIEERDILKENIKIQGSKGVSKRNLNS